MSDIIRMARAMYPDYDQMAAEAHRIKQEYVAGGGNPMDVYSPERVDVFKKGGMPALESMQTATRKDGSIAGPYVPLELALSKNMIEQRALPAVMQAARSGVHTVSSGFDKDKGVGFAIGRDPSGSVVRIEQ